MIFAKLNANGRLTDLRRGPQQPGGLWPDGSQDVPLASMPDFIGPYAYDNVNHLAIQPQLTADEKTIAVNQTQSLVLCALCIRDSVSRGATIPLAIRLWAISTIDAVTDQVVTARS